MNVPSEIDHPSHYTPEKIECIEALESIGVAPDFCLGNAIKYLWRCKRKGQRLQDLKKAQWYLTWLINYHEDKNP